MKNLLAIPIIKEIRLKIDGLSKLIKELSIIKVLDIKQIPEGWNIDKWLEELKKMRISVIEESEVKIIDLKNIELENCFKSLILAKAWLGKVLEDCGEISPYKNNGKRNNINDIELPADILVDNIKEKRLPNSDIKFKYTTISNYFRTNKNNEDEIDLDCYNYESKNNIQKIDWLREEIKTIIDNINNLHSIHDSLHSENVYSNLVEARFWLGFELQKIKETNNK